MIKINKQECVYLSKNGVPYGENGISRTYGHHKHYYLCETKRNMKILNDYRNSIRENNK